MTIVNAPKVLFLLSSQGVTMYQLASSQKQSRVLLNMYRNDVI